MADLTREQIEAMRPNADNLYEMAANHGYTRVDRHVLVSLCDMALRATRQPVSNERVRVAAATFLADFEACRSCIDSGIALKQALAESAAQPASEPYAPDVADAIERTVWTSEDALRFYADGKHFDTVQGRTRIIDTGAIASSALKNASLQYAEMKGVSQPVSAPVAWMYDIASDGLNDVTQSRRVVSEWPDKSKIVPLYISPPTREQIIEQRDCVMVPREAIRCAADAIDIADDWNLPDVQVNPPKEWGLASRTEDVADGWCSTRELANYLRSMLAGRTT